MSWMDRLLGRERPVRATPTQIAESMAGVIAHLTDQLMGELRRNRAPEHGAMFMAECLTFTAFPFDVIIGAELEVHSDIIREKLRACLFGTLQSVADSLPSRYFDEFDAHLQARFNEYIRAWRSAEGGQGLERLGRAAAQAIYGSDMVGLSSMFACSTHAATIFSCFRGISAKYELVAEQA